MKDGELRIAGLGAVTAAGWDVAAALTALEAGLPLAQGAAVRRVPEAGVKPEWLKIPRLRRASPATRFAAVAALEALGIDEPSQAPRLGLVAIVINAAVQYSGRFYGEVLVDPAQASPILFPETVFNAPGSHLCALLGADGPSATLVGDAAAQVGAGLRLAWQWLAEDEGLEGVLLVALEEADPLTQAGMQLLDPQRAVGEGAAALWLQRGRDGSKVARNAPADDNAALQVEDSLRESSLRLHWRELFGLDEAELRAELAAVLPSFPVEPVLITGGSRLAHERVASQALAERAGGSALLPVFGDLFAVNGLLALVLAGAQVRQTGRSCQAWDLGAWHGGLLARVSR